MAIVNFCTVWGDCCRSTSSISTVNVQICQERNNEGGKCYHQARTIFGNFRDFEEVVERKLEMTDYLKVVIWKNARIGLNPFIGVWLKIIW